jgi:anti-sigma factor RsiW
MSHERRELDPNAGGASLEEQLVAYLDGELSDEETARIEQRLSDDPQARASLVRLERTWSMLDQLQRASLDEKFTRTTLEMVAVSAEEELARWQANAPRRRLRRWLFASGGLLAAAVTGFLGVAMFWPSPNQQLLQSLPVYEDLDELSKVDDIEFLQLLYEEGLFTKDPGDDV